MKTLTVVMTDKFHRELKQTVGIKQMTGNLNPDIDPVDMLATIVVLAADGGDKVVFAKNKTIHARLVSTEEEEDGS